MFITAAPTETPTTPTTVPSRATSSTVPSAVPTITGAISSVSMSGAVTADMDASEISDITSELSDIYGVDPSDIETTVDYVTSGTLDIIVPDDLPEAEVIESLQDSISDVLGVHSSDVVITIDDDGVVTYSVTGASYEEVSAIQNNCE